MISPHAANELRPLFVRSDKRRKELLEQAETLPSVTLTSAAAANAVMLGAGYFSPLGGYMRLADALSVAETMHTTDGLFWPVPVLNIVEQVAGLSPGDTIALRDPNVEDAPVLAVMELEHIDEVSADQLSHMAQHIFGTTDTAHPGAAVFLEQGTYVLSGPIQVLNYSYYDQDFPDTFVTAYDLRDQIESRGWNKVVAFQTRNPMHLAHEELCRMALERLDADGLVIHMLLGKLKPGDIPADVRDACIRKMVETYFPENTALVNGYGFDMLYAGPREAVLHAVFRQNMGASHLIVGRDHAGVGDFYGPFDAQAIFDQVPDGALEIEIFAADHTAWSKKLKKVVMMREVEDHTPEDYIFLSGTKVREMLSEGIAPPVEFSRPEVSEILMQHYQRSA